MNVLVLGGTGTVGSQVVRELLKKGVDVSILTRDAKKPVPSGARAVVGDLLDPSTIRSAFPGRDAVFLLNTVSASECHEGLMAVNGARMAGVKKVVYLSVQDADKAAHLPHFGAKVAVEIALKASRIPFTILRPNNFYQNDTWYKDVMLSYDVYPQPFGDVGVSRVDVRDIAEIAALALTTDAARNETVNVVGPEMLTATGTAATWGGVLGRKIAYGGTTSTRGRRPRSRSCLLRRPSTSGSCTSSSRRRASRPRRRTSRGARPPRPPAAALRRVRGRDGPRLERLSSG